MKSEGISMPVAESKTDKVSSVKTKQVPTDKDDDLLDIRLSTSETYKEKPGMAPSVMTITTTSTINLPDNITVQDDTLPKL